MLTDNEIEQKATALAQQIHDDKSFFSEEKDRRFIKDFMKPRIIRLAKALSDPKKLLDKDYDRVGCIILKAVEDGITI